LSPFFRSLVEKILIALVLAGHHGILWVILSKKSFKYQPKMKKKITKTTKINHKNKLEKKITKKKSQKKNHIVKM